MADVPRPPAQASPPSHHTNADGTPVRNRHPENDGAEPGAGAAASEPAVEEIEGRSFAGQNFAPDQQRQARERGAGLGAGSSGNRDARHPAQGDGDVPEDDID